MLNLTLAGKRIQHNVCVWGVEGNCVVKDECHLLSLFCSTLFFRAALMWIAGPRLFISVLAWIRLISDKFPALSCRCELSLQSRELVFFFISVCLFVCLPSLTCSQLSPLKVGRSPHREAPTPPWLGFGWVWGR